MFKKTTFWYKVAALILVATLIIPALAACGNDDDDETTAPTLAPTKPPITVATTTPPPVSKKDPIKIGGIGSWSGPAAMSGTVFGDQSIKLIEKQVKDMGGILGGRMVEIVKCDNKGMVAQASACATKLILNDDVSALLWGGVSAAEFAAAADEAEKLRVPLITFSDFAGVDEMEFTVVSSPRAWQLTSFIVDIVIGKLKPKTVGFLSMEEGARIERIKKQSEAFKAAGIEVVYSQTVPFGTTDYAPYLTKMKYEHPDVLVVNVESEQARIIAKTMMELGGWGDTKLVGTSQLLSAANMPGAKGWILLTPWNPGGDYPASRKFEEEFKALTGRGPTSNHLYFYLSALTAVEAIKLAGSDDPVAINEAIRSGNLEFETAMGMSHFTPEGDSGLKYIFVQIQEDGSTAVFDWEN